MMDGLESSPVATEAGRQKRKKRVRAWWWWAGDGAINYLFSPARTAEVNGKSVGGEGGGVKKVGKVLPRGDRGGWGWRSESSDQLPAASHFHGTPRSKGHRKSLLRPLYVARLSQNYFGGGRASCRNKRHRELPTRTPLTHTPRSSCRPPGGRRAWPCCTAGCPRLLRRP